MTLSTGQRFTFDGINYEIDRPGPAITLLREVGTERFLHVETYKVKYIVEQGESNAHQSQKTST